MPARKPGLGKGLGALIPEDNEVQSTSGVMELSISQITPNPHQPRTKFDEAELAELAASIKEHGIIQPLVVTKGKDEGYILIAGGRRLAASKMVNLEKVPVIEREVTDQEMLLLALIENVQRADLNPIETAKAYQNLSDNFGLTHAQIGDLVGKSRESVSNTLGLLNASHMVQEALKAGDLDEGHASALRTLPVQTQNELVEAHKEYKFSVRQIERLTRHMKDIPLEKQLSELKKALNKRLYLPQKEKEKAEKAQETKSAPAAEQASLAAEMEDVRRRLADHFLSKVSIRTEGKGGAITITYDDTEDLNRILDLILEQ